MTQLFKIYIDLPVDNINELNNNYSKIECIIESNNNINITKLGYDMISKTLITNKDEILKYIKYTGWKTFFHKYKYVELFHYYCEETNKKENNILNLENLHMIINYFLTIDVIEKKLMINNIYINYTIEENIEEYFTFIHKCIFEFIEIKYLDWISKQIYYLNISKIVLNQVYFI